MMTSAPLLSPWNYQQSEKRRRNKQQQTAGAGTTTTTTTTTTTISSAIDNKSSKDKKNTKKGEKGATEKSQKQNQKEANNNPEAESVSAVLASAKVGVSTSTWAATAPPVVVPTSSTTATTLAQKKRRKNAALGVASAYSNRTTSTDYSPVEEPCYVGHSRHLERLHRLATTSIALTTRTSTTDTAQESAVAVFFLGASGTGKTTFLERFASEFHDLNSSDDLLQLENSETMNYDDADLESLSSHSGGGEEGEELEGDGCFDGSEEHNDGDCNSSDDEDDYVAMRRRKAKQQQLKQQQQDQQQPITLLASVRIRRLKYMDSDNNKDKDNSINDDEDDANLDSSSAAEAAHNHTVSSSDTLVEDPLSILYDAVDSLLSKFTAAADEQDPTIHIINAHNNKLSKRQRLQAARLAAAAKQSKRNQYNFLERLQQSMTTSDLQLLMGLIPRLKRMLFHHLQQQEIRAGGGVMEQQLKQIKQKQEDQDEDDEEEDGEHDLEGVNYLSKEVHSSQVEHYQPPVLPRIKKLLVGLLQELSAVLTTPSSHTSNGGAAGGGGLIMLLIDDLHLAHEAVLDVLEELLNQFSKPLKTTGSSANSQLRLLLVATAATTTQQKTKSIKAGGGGESEDDGFKQQPGTATELELEQQPSDLERKLSCLQDEDLEVEVSVQQQEANASNKNGAHKPGSSVMSAGTATTALSVGSKDSNADAAAEIVVSTTSPARSSTRPTNFTGGRGALASMANSNHSNQSVTSANSCSTAGSSVNSTTGESHNTLATAYHLQQMIFRLNIRREICRRNMQLLDTTNDGGGSSDSDKSENRNTPLHYPVLLLKSLHAWSERHIEKWLLLTNTASITNHYIKYQQQHKNSGTSSTRISRAAHEREVKRTFRALAAVLYEKTGGHMLSVIYLMRLLKDLRVFGDDIIETCFRDDSIIQAIRNMPVGSKRRQDSLLLLDTTAPSASGPSSIADSTSDTEDIRQKYDFTSNSSIEDSGTDDYDDDSITAEFSDADRAPTRPKTTPSATTATQLRQSKHKRMSSNSSAASATSSCCTEALVSSATGIIDAIILLKLKALPESVRGVLVYASFLNAHVFSATHLHSVMAKKASGNSVSVDDLNDILHYSAKRGFLTQLGTAHSGTAYFSFAHACVREQVYAWMASPKKQQQLHWTIGQRLKTLLKHISATGAPQQTLLLQSLAQLNRAVALSARNSAGAASIKMDSKDVKILVQLNLLAAKRAMSDNSPLIAVDLLRRTLSYLAGDKPSSNLRDSPAWNSDFDTMLDVMMTLAEAEFACGNHLECSKLGRSIRHQVLNLGDRLPFCHLEISSQYYSRNNELGSSDAYDDGRNEGADTANAVGSENEAISSTLSVLSRLGETFVKESRHKAEITKQVKQIHQQLRKQKTFDSRSLHTGLDENDQSMCHRIAFLERLAQVSVGCSETYYSLAMLRILTHTLERKRNFGPSGLAFAHFGSLLTEQSKYGDAHRFAKISLYLDGVDELFDAQALVAYYSGSFAWTQPYESPMSEILEQTCQFLTGHATFDIASNAIISSFWVRLGSESNLNILDRELYTLLKSLNLHRRYDLARKVLPYAKIVSSLTGTLSSILAISDRFVANDQNEMEGMDAEDFSSVMGRLSLALTYFHFYELDRAGLVFGSLLDDSKKPSASDPQDGDSSIVAPESSPLQLFIVCMMCLSLVSSSQKKKGSIELSAAHKKKMNACGNSVISLLQMKFDCGATNCVAYLRLLQAQAKVCAARPAKTIVTTTEEGLGHCRQLGFLYPRALVYEQLGIYCMGRKDTYERGTKYMKLSRKLYKEWGAHAKEQHLKHQYSDVFTSKKTDA